MLDWGGHLALKVIREGRLPVKGHLSEWMFLMTLKGFWFKGYCLNIWNLVFQEKKRLFLHYYYYYYNYNYCYYILFWFLYSPHPISNKDCLSSIFCVSIIFSVQIHFFFPPPLLTWLKGFTRLFKLNISTFFSTSLSLLKRVLYAHITHKDWQDALLCLLHLTL